LEENWEIKQSLKELRELKGQNEVNLALKKEEQLRAGDSLELYEKLEKEITALNEVMTNNEKIEAEMQANLDKNVQEKKQIEEKMLVASSQYTTLVNAAKCYDGFEKTLSNQHTEKNTLNEKISLGKEFVNLHKEKAEKDTKIHELEQEISKMKRELAEKVKF